MGGEAPAGPFGQPITEEYRKWLVEWTRVGGICPVPPGTIERMREQGPVHIQTEGHQEDCQCPKCEPWRW